MRVIQITKAGSGAPNVWVEAGIHAREWIASGMIINFYFTYNQNVTTAPCTLTRATSFFLVKLILNFFFLATTTYLINWLVNGDGNDLLDHINFHILPLANPDGYEYSRDHVSSFHEKISRYISHLLFFLIRIVIGEKIVESIVAAIVKALI